MPGQAEPNLVFQQVHIDVARNATDDFNPFHDPLRSHRIHRNPFSAPIVLGFQLECLCEYLIEKERRRLHDESFPPIDELPYSNFQFNFAGTLLPDQPFTVQVKPGKKPTRPRDRVIVRKTDGQVVLLGSQQESKSPPFLDQPPTDRCPALNTLPDRAPIADTGYFLKRKYLGTANGKNFLLSALADQSHYIDELSEQVRFPAIFPAALLSNALLEMAWSEGYDFEADPMVYTAHQICVDRRVLAELRSNTMLHLLVTKGTPMEASHALGKSRSAELINQCFGLLDNERVLFRAIIHTASLHDILDAADESRTQ